MGDSSTDALGGRPDARTAPPLSAPIASPAGRRAPRLRPDEHLAPHITRRGRFTRVDPLVPKPLPSAAQVLGVVGWVVLTVTSFRKARAASTGSSQAQG